MRKPQPNSLLREPLLYRLRAFVAKPANLLLVFFLFVLAVLSLLPMVTMLSNMFTLHMGIEKRQSRMSTGDWTYVHFQKLFEGGDWSRVNFWEPLKNSLIVATGAGILGILIGGSIAWLSLVLT